MFLYSKLGGTLSITLVAVFVVGFIFLRLQQRVEQLGELSLSLMIIILRVW